MDKVLKGVIIFAVCIVVIATASIFVVLSKNSPQTNSYTTTPTNNPSGTSSTGTVVQDGNVQVVKLSVSGANYILTPSVLKKDVPVRMEADMATLRGCSRDVVISAFGVRKAVTTGDNIITFTPTKTGTINIACSMNMYRGTFTVE